MKNISVIFGGAGGIGRATAIALADSSAIVIGDLVEENIEYTSKILKSLNIEHYCAHMDVRDRAACDKLMADAEKLGHIKNVINIAGLSPNTTYTQSHAATGREIYETNCVGALNTLEAAFPYLSEGSVMVQTASQAFRHAELTDRLLSVFMSCYQDGFLDRLTELTEIFDDEDSGNGQAYCVSKRFVYELCQANTKRFAQKGIRLVTVSPGMHWTCHVWDLDQDTIDGNLANTPLGCYGRTVDLGRIFAFLCSDTAKYMTGADVLVDGGGMTAFGKWKIK